jgi:2-keto-4-pentenoate hydratase
MTIKGPSGVERTTITNPGYADSDRIAEAFVTARREGRALPDFPGAVPTTLDQAYAVQDAALARDPRTVGGWKVGRINPPRDGVDRLAGPIFADQIFDARGGEAIAMPVFAEGFAAAEAEFLMQLGSAPDPTQTRFTMDDAAALIGAVHVGIEVASSPFPGINALGPTVTISDYGNNNGLVVGPAIANWREAGILDWPVELRINGAAIGAATAATMLDGPVGAVRFLLELAAARGIALQAGCWVSSGAVTGVHEVVPGDAIEARFGEGAITRCTITAR